MEVSVIDLADYLPKGEKVVSEWEEGKRVRDDSGINEQLESLNESEFITIKLPDQIRFISPAFLEGFLSEAVRRYGRAGFSSRVQFTEAPLYNIGDDLEEAIDRVLTEQNARLSASAWM